MKSFLETVFKKALSFVCGRYQHSDYFLRKRTLSLAAEKLIQSALQDLDSRPVVDYHVHVIGTNTASTGNYINAKFLSGKSPISYLASLAFQSAFGIEDIYNADEEVIERLRLLIEDIPYPFQCSLLAFDRHFNARGCFDSIKSMFFVSNRHVYDSAARYPKLFVPCISVHPYRANAIALLEYWAARGVRIVKWLPNTMGMNFKDARSLRFFKKMNALNLILISHGGNESTLPFSSEQELGNPLMLRYALDEGVSVIMAHCATSGKGIDYDNAGKRVDNFDLFLRLMHQRAYKDQLFGDISSITQMNRIQYLDRIIELAQPGNLLADRIVNGSDYPLPAFDCLISTYLLKKKGYISAQERSSLNEIYARNPLLFDFVLKRTLKHPRTQRAFAPSVFVMHPQLDIRNHCYAEL